jgi:hypothetical protein
MANKRLLDAIERGFDIGRRVGVFAFPITDRSRVTSRCAGKFGFCVSPASMRPARICRPETTLPMAKLIYRFRTRRH